MRKLANRLLALCADCLLPAWLFILAAMAAVWRATGCLLKADEADRLERIKAVSEANRNAWIR